MPVFQSPGVYVKETDLSRIIATVNSTTAAIVGASNKGISNERVLITNAKDFVDMFGEPNLEVSFMHYAALGYLTYGSQLWVTRVNKNAYYAGVNILANKANNDATTAEIANNVSAVDTFSAFNSEAAFAIFAANEGTWGNNIQVRITNTNVNALTFDIQVYFRESGNYILKETFTVSRRVQLDGNRAQLFLEDRINGVSKYIRVKNNANQADTILPDYQTPTVKIGDGNGNATTFTSTLTGVIQRFSVKVSRGGTQVLTDDGNGNLLSNDVLASNGAKGTINYETGAISVTFNTAPSNSTDIDVDYNTVVVASLTKGSNGSAIDDSDVIEGWDLYKDTDSVDVRILINGGQVSVPVQNKMKDLCESRADCIAILDTPDCMPTAAETVEWRRNTQNINSSYVALYAPRLIVFDQYSNREVCIPPSGHIAGIYANNDNVSNYFSAPAGLDRGLLSVVSLSNNYTQGERDVLYESQINFIRTFPGQGTAVWGQRTQQTDRSALSSVNVRRLLIVLEKSISISLLNSVFELNTEFTRLRISQQIESFLRGVRDAGGLYDYRVVVDSSNNTPETIDLNELHADIYLKPTRAIEFIELQAVVTATSANFSELLGSGGRF